MCVFNKRKLLSEYLHIYRYIFYFTRNSDGIRSIGTREYLNRNLK